MKDILRQNVYDLNGHRTKLYKKLQILFGNDEKKAFSFSKIAVTDLFMLHLYF